MTDDLTITARVQITLDIAVTDSWGSECAFAQVNEQARASVLGMLRNRPGMPPELAQAKIIGEPHVVAILTERKR